VVKFLECLFLKLMIISYCSGFMYYVKCKDMVRRVVCWVGFLFLWDRLMYWLWKGLYEMGMVIFFLYGIFDMTYVFLLFRWYFHLMIFFSFYM